MTRLELCAALIALLLLAACAGGPYHNPPRFAAPETRTAAARQLNEALAAGGIGYADIDADKERLSYSERRANRWLRRELSYAAIYGVDEARQDGARWMVRVDAAGGALKLRFQDAHNAAKAESALMRLSPLHAAPGQ